MHTHTHTRIYASYDAHVHTYMYYVRPTSDIVATTIIAVGRETVGLAVQGQTLSGTVVETSHKIFLVVNCCFSLRPREQQKR